MSAPGRNANAVKRTATECVNIVDVGAGTFASITKRKGESVAASMRIESRLNGPAKSKRKNEEKEGTRTRIKRRKRRRGEGDERGKAYSYICLHKSGRDYASV